MSENREDLGVLPSKKRKHQINTELDSRSPDAHSIIAGRKGKAEPVVPQNANQITYLKYLQLDPSEGPIVGGFGPAGTGKTYMAVAAACEALNDALVNRIVITRPAVSDENLGFLPGDMKQKMDEYLQPIYDALYEFLGKTVVDKYIEEGVILIVPFAYMKGRTFKKAFVIVDEAEDCTEKQMRLFLTRIGYGSKYVICGDNSQTDLDIRNGKLTGLDYINALAEDLGEDFKSVMFTVDDATVRHPVVAKVLKADEKLRERRRKQQQ